MSVLSKDDVRVILATDCGSTTSKARFFMKIGDEFRFIASGEAPTTVEAPYEDVTVGVRNAVREVEELTGYKLLGDDTILPSNGKGAGVDIYATTSSAGGGLQMTVIGVVRNMTAESAERAALGAGAIVMDVVSSDEEREDFEKIARIRTLRPDMILFAGGTDGGNLREVIELAEFIRTANPRARFGASYSLPIVYAGNINARGQIKEILDQGFSLNIVNNIRPRLDMENPAPARNAVHEAFMKHVMSHAPGYNRLMKWTPIPIMPTPMGEGLGVQTIARIYRANTIGVGLGGATTNVYSIFDEKFVRTVSANLGMSYSICNVLREASFENIIRWIPFQITELELRNRLYNKMIRPTTIPHTMDDLIIEHAVARESLRLAFQHHQFLATPLHGVSVGIALDKLFEDLEAHEETYIDSMRIEWIAGTGGLLSHAPRRVQSAMILIDGFRPAGITNLVQDSVFMMPHLGVLSTVHQEASIEIFEKDCLVRLGVCIALNGAVKEKTKRDVATIKITWQDGKSIEENVESGLLKRYPLSTGETAEVEVTPRENFDVGAGSNRSLEATIQGGIAGIILDTRGRPFELPEDEEVRRSTVLEWYKNLDAYPSRYLDRFK
jgi:uncharacterized protein (TIGR01319 family)